jgi:hypothetical protein
VKEGKGRLDKYNIEGTKFCDEKLKNIVSLDTL